jgi:hypothetical protein
MARYDDDWVGTPPEGRHSRDRADPAFWARQWKPQLLVFGTLGILVLVVLLLALL